MAKTLKESYASKDELKRLNDFMAVMVVVLFIGFAAAFIAIGGIVNDYLAQRHAANQSLRDQVKAQNDKIEALTKAINEQKTIQAPN